MTRLRSDVLVPGQEFPQFLEITAECQVDVEVPAGRTVEVVYRSTGSSTCDIATPDE